jgi:hypothetical protein
MRNARADGLGEYDFYDVNGNRVINAVDTGLVRANWNGSGPTPPEDLIYDRDNDGLHVWAPGPPDNQIDAIDVGLVRAAFNHTCVKAP